MAGRRLFKEPPALAACSPSAGPLQSVIPAPERPPTAPPPTSDAVDAVTTSSESYCRLRRQKRRWTPLNGEILQGQYKSLSQRSTDRTGDSGNVRIGANLVAVGYAARAEVHFDKKVPPSGR